MNPVPWRIENMTDIFQEILKKIGMPVLHMHPNLKTIGLTVALIIVCLGCFFPFSAAAENLLKENKPNIVIIIADDLGWADVGFHGSDIHTPNIDTLADKGAKLERFYAFPFCTPTRASLLTGRYPFRYGLQTAAIPADGKYGLDMNEHLLPQMLKKAGYRTAIVGKWHLGHADERYWPRNRGFDYQYGPLGGEIDYYTHSVKGKRDWYENHVPLIEDGYATELIGSKAVQVLLEHDTDTPLFLYLTFTAPHAPYQVPVEYEEQYRNITDPTRRTYAGMVTSMDDQIGRVLDTLDLKGIRKNTLIFFMSDNGGNRSSIFSGESDVSELNLPASNSPYRGGKGTILEGGCRVVAVVNWPGHIMPRTILDPIHVVDLLPTFAGIAGASTQGAHSPDGIDQWKLFTSGTGASRIEVVYNIEPYRAAISKGKWKVILKPAFPPLVELYDLESDPSEETNVADLHPEQVEQLQKRIVELSKEARMPLFFGYTLEHSDQLKKFIAPMLPE
jgi:arylsulfatase A-like enzyme